VLIWYYNQFSGMNDAAPAVCVLLAVSLIVMTIHNRAGLGRQE
jgi:ABC-type Fe3+ transport system permease subunit